MDEHLHSAGMLQNQRVLALDHMGHCSIKRCIYFAFGRLNRNPLAHLLLGKSRIRHLLQRNCGSVQRGGKLQNVQRFLRRLYRMTAV
ncbi:hypothetical protein D3C75_1226210 [compost metagenome]